MELEYAESLCKKIVQKLPEKAEALRKLLPMKENTAWTKAIKAILEELAQPEYECLYSAPKADNHEFLADFTWWDKNRKRLILACESEFGNPRDRKNDLDRIGYDFDKLLSIKAEMKLMIFDSNSLKSGQILENLTSRAREFSQHCAGEIYMLLDTVAFEDTTRVRLWGAVIQRDSTNPDLAFMPTLQPITF
jgi:hypothetical protein